MGLKFTVVSDLHLEFAPAKLQEGADVLLLAGDIIPAAPLVETRTDKDSRKVRGRMDQFCSEELPKFKEVFYIMGNHEHYHGLWELTAEVLRDYLKVKAPHVKLLEKEFTNASDGTMIWGGTLWTNFRDNCPMIMNCARLGMNDYNLIKTMLPANTMYAQHNFRKMQPEMIYEDHLAAFKSLKEAVEAFPSCHWLVMSHHGPSYKSIDQRFGNDPLNYCYASDYSEFMLDHPQINCWVHGHTHTSHLYVIGETTVVCNPRGYTNLRLEPENKTFDPGLQFEIKNDKPASNT